MNPAYPAIDPNGLKVFDCPECNTPNAVIEDDVGFTCRECGAEFPEGAFDDHTDDLYTYITPREAVEYLREQGVPLPQRLASAREALNRLRKWGKIKYVRTLGGHHRYILESLEDFVKQRGK